LPSVNVTINGKNYRMACDEGQEDHRPLLLEKNKLATMILQKALKMLQRKSTNSA